MFSASRKYFQEQLGQAYVAPPAVIVHSKVGTVRSFFCAVAQQDPPVNAMEWAIVARDQQVTHFRCAQPPTANPDKCADELLDAYLFQLRVCKYKP